MPTLVSSLGEIWCHRNLHCDSIQIGDLLILKINLKENVSHFLRAGKGVFSVFCSTAMDHTTNPSLADMASSLQTASCGYIHHHATPEGSQTVT